MAVYSSCDHQAKGPSSRRPMGCRFHPTNKKLLKYLLGFVRDQPLLQQYQLMQQVDLYGDKEPWQIFEGTNNNTRYFITQQKKVKPGWKRFARTAGKGTWKPQDKGKEVFDDKGRLMGYVKSLKYIAANKSSNKANGEWLMTEYSLYNGYVDASKIKKKGFVICKIKKKEKPGDKKKGNNSEVVNEENMKDIEELINSILQEKVGEDINGRISNDDIRLVAEDDHQAAGNDIEYLEEDQVEEHILAMLGCSTDDVDSHEHNVEEYINSEDNEIAKDEEKIEYLEGEQVEDHVLALLEDMDLDTFDFV
ncbi:NAC domain-containing protein 83-like [Lycium ferocissimum]|uniref:NAC domain-containing protein 83-like n=1 Tax=Lycium ferocissimum TaxID=112874 RepID=UPI0028163A9C|nr:NAC domain-containing protein 83-like [Lycium ferocissimum]